MMRQTRHNGLLNRLMENAAFCGRWPVHVSTLR